ncbi:MAG: serpin family protein [Methanocellales archaeon]
MKWKVITFAIITIALATIANVLLLYNSPENISNRANDTSATSEGISSIVNANNQFALDLYSELNNETGNLFFSPLSISTAFAMIYEGARGQTAEEIQSIFHFPEDNTTRRSSFAAIYNQLNKESGRCKLHTANALWIQKNYPTLDEFTTLILRYYAGNATNLDFEGATEEARLTINNWVDDKTNGKIKDLFPQGSLNSLTRLVLTNAIYFKGNWVKQFDKNGTIPEAFRVSPNNTVQVDMMRRTDEESKFNYTETEELQILEMLYEGKDLSMLILLPKNDDIKTLEKSLTLEKLKEWKNSLKEQRVNVFIPKFTFNRKYILNENLKAMGMPSAFTPGSADLSGIDGTRNLFIQIVIHQSFVDVNEEGTEAAASTGVGIGLTSITPKVPIFRADHPFIFLIQEKKTGNILFLGKVVDPR